MAAEREISKKDGVSICRPKLAHSIKFAILWAVIISIWMMFEVPVVLYHLQEVCYTSTIIFLWPTTNVNNH